MRVGWLGKRGHAFMRSERETTAPVETGGVVLQDGSCRKETRALTPESRMLFAHVEAMAAVLPHESQ